MKKFVFLFLCLFVVCTGAFASGKKENANTVAITGGYQASFYKFTSEGVECKNTYHGLGIGIDIREMFTDIVGLYGHIGVNLPMAARYSSGNFSFDYKRSDFNSLFGMEIYIGPAFMPIKQENLTLNVSPVLHFGMLMAKNSLDDSGLGMIGLGADVSVDYYFTEKFFLTAGVLASFDFLQILGNDYSSPMNFLIKPKLGIGFRW